MAVPGKGMRPILTVAKSKIVKLDSERCGLEERPPTSGRIAARDSVIGL